jgi:hypothetical protein
MTCIRCSTKLETLGKVFITCHVCKSTYHKDFVDGRWVMVLDNKFFKEKIYGKI